MRLISVDDVSIIAGLWSGATMALRGNLGVGWWNEKLVNIQSENQWGNRKYQTSSRLSKLITSKHQIPSNGRICTVRVLIKEVKISVPKFDTESITLTMG